MIENKIFLAPSEKLSNFFFVRWFEMLTGKSLCGYKLYLVGALGMSLVVSVPTYTVLFVTSYFIEVENSTVQLLIDAAVGFIKMFLVFFRSCFLYMVSPFLFRWAFNHHEKKTIAFAGAVSVIGLAACVVLTVKVLPIFWSDTTQAVLEADKCGDDIPCNSIRKVGLAVSQVNSAREPNYVVISGEERLASFIEKYGLSEDMSLEEFNQWLKDNGMEEYDIYETNKIVEKPFESISLFSESNIENWEEFFLELDEVAATKPAFVGLVISKAVISNPSLDNLIEILDRGYTLDGSHVSILASELNIEELNVLENYGVDLAAKSADGENALVASLLNPDSKDVFDYFLSKDQIVFSEEVDILKGVLDMSSMLGGDISYANKLLDRGVTITEDTKRWIETDLKRQNYDFYKEVKDKLDI